jgi:hypothetical protein
MRTYMSLLDDRTEEPLWGGEVSEVPADGDTLTYDAAAPTAGVVRIVRRHWAVGPGPHGEGWQHVTVRGIPRADDDGGLDLANPLPVDPAMLDHIVQMAILGNNDELTRDSTVPQTAGRPRPETKVERDRRVIRAAIGYGLRYGLLVVGNPGGEGRWFPVEEPPGTAR